MRFSARTLVCLLGTSTIAFLPAACSSSSSTTIEKDSGAGFDTGTDTGTTPVKDGGHDAKDAAKDSAKDSSKPKDTGSDTTTDTGTDAPTEAGDAGDAGLEGGDAAFEGGDATATDAGDATASDAGDASDATTDGPVEGGDAVADVAVDAGPAQTTYFMGRWDSTTAPATAATPIAEWPGSAILATFSGSNITLTLNETCNANGFGCDTITVVIANVDGTESVATTYTLTAGLNALLVGNNLSTTQNHTIAVYKNTDGLAGYGGKYQFISFALELGFELVPTTYAFPHHIEFVGDDTAAGTGVLGGAVNCDDLASNSDAYDSYPTLTANYFGAEFQNLSLANVGAYDSDPTSAGTAPPLASALYPLVLPSESTSLYTFADFNADLVVVNVGNYSDLDFYPGDTDPGAAAFVTNYENALVQLFTNIRTAHPTAPIFVTLGPGYGGAPTPAEANSWVSAAVTQYQASTTPHETGTQISAYFADTAGYTYGGCQSRLSVGDQEKYAGWLESTIHTDFDTSFSKAK